MAASSSFFPTKKKWLNWRDRPPELKKCILNAFKKVNSSPKSFLGINWNFNGDHENPYEICELNEYSLIKSMIQANPDRKSFYVMDIGAGNFGFGRGLAKFLNESTDIPNDVQVHIISVRGEDNTYPPVKIEGICISYEIGGFQVENISDELDRCGLDITEKLDLIVSSHTFRHLVDPVGTFSQMYNLLRPGTGLMMANNDFDYYLQKENGSNEFGETMNILQKTWAPFVYKGSVEGFILRRPDNKTCCLPFNYVGLENEIEEERKELSGKRIVLKKVLTKESNNVLEINNDKNFNMDITIESVTQLPDYFKRQIDNEEIIEAQIKEERTNFPRVFLENDLIITEETRKKIIAEMDKYTNSRGNKKEGKWELNWFARNFYDSALTERKLKLADRFLGYANEANSSLMLMAMIRECAELDNAWENENGKQHSIFTNSEFRKVLDRIQNIFNQEREKHYQNKISRVSDQTDGLETNINILTASTLTYVQ